MPAKTPGLLMCPLCRAKNVSLDDGRCSACAGLLRQATCSACGLEKYGASFIPTPVVRRPANSRWMWPGTLTPAEEAALVSNAGAMTEAFVCAGCVSRALRRHVLDRWRDAAIATVVAVLLVLLKSPVLTALAVLAALTCLLLAAQASWIIRRRSAASADIVCRFVRIHGSRLGERPG